jgi:hypothetical protein
MRLNSRPSSGLRIFFAAVAAGVIAVSPAAAVGLREVIRDCADDGENFCAGVGYGAPMQACLAGQYKKLSPACRAIIDRLNKGETVGIFG